MSNKRSKFNWSILDRQGLIDYFWSLYPRICDIEMPTTRLHSKIAKHIKEQLPVRLTKKRDVKVDEGWIWVGGTYFSEWDREKKQCIELVLVYNLFQETTILTKRRWKRVCHTLADTLLHEIMHMRQYRRRKFKELPDYASSASREEKRQEQEYLGHSDEIDAYSFNIACELLDKFKNDPRKVINYLSENQEGTRRRHNCWRMYLKAFDHNHNHPIIHRVKKKVIRYLPHAMNGKPYRNKDWINR